MNVKTMGVWIKKGSVMAAAFEHQISLGVIAAGVAGRGDRMAVEVEDVLEDSRPRAPWPTLTPYPSAVLISLVQGNGQPP
jgi:hypothetical protein